MEVLQLSSVGRDQKLKDMLLSSSQEALATISSEETKQVTATSAGNPAPAQKPAPLSTKDGNDQVMVLKPEKTSHLSATASTMRTISARSSAANSSEGLPEVETVAGETMTMGSSSWGFSMGSGLMTTGDSKQRFFRSRSQKLLAAKMKQSSSTNVLGIALGLDKEEAVEDFHSAKIRQGIENARKKRMVPSRQWKTPYEVDAPRGIMLPRDHMLETSSSNSSHSDPTASVGTTVEQRIWTGIEALMKDAFSDDDSSTLNSADVLPIALVKAMSQRSLLSSDSATARGSTVTSRGEYEMAQATLNSFMDMLLGDTDDLASMPSLTTFHSSNTRSLGGTSANTRKEGDKTDIEEDEIQIVRAEAALNTFMDVLLQEVEENAAKDKPKESTLHLLDLFRWSLRVNVDEDERVHHEQIRIVEEEQLNELRRKEEELQLQREMEEAELQRLEDEGRRLEEKLRAKVEEAERLRRLDEEQRRLEDERRNDQSVQALGRLAAPRSPSPTSFSRAMNSSGVPTPGASEITGSMEFSSLAPPSGATSSARELSGQEGGESTELSSPSTYRVPSTPLRARAPSPSLGGRASPSLSGRVSPSLSGRVSPSLSGRASPVLSAPAQRRRADAERRQKEAEEAQRIQQEEEARAASPAPPTLADSRELGAESTPEDSPIYSQSRTSESESGMLPRELGSVSTPTLSTLDDIDENSELENKVVAKSWESIGGVPIVMSKDDEGGLDASKLPALANKYVAATNAGADSRRAVSSRELRRRINADGPSSANISSKSVPSAPTASVRAQNTSYMYNESEASLDPSALPTLASLRKEGVQPSYGGKGERPTPPTGNSIPQWAAIGGRPIVMTTESHLMESNITDYTPSTHNSGILPSSFNAGKDYATTTSSITSGSSLTMSQKCQGTVNSSDEMPELKSISESSYGSNSTNSSNSSETMSTPRDSITTGRSHQSQQSDTLFSDSFVKGDASALQSVGNLSMGEEFPQFFRLPSQRVSRLPSQRLMRLPSQRMSRMPSQRAIVVSAAGDIFADDVSLISLSRFTHSHFGNSGGGSGSSSSNGNGSSGGNTSSYNNTTSSGNYNTTSNSESKNNTTSNSDSNVNTSNSNSTPYTASGPGTIREFSEEDLDTPRRDPRLRKPSPSSLRQLRTEVHSMVSAGDIHVGVIVDIEADDLLNAASVGEITLDTELQDDASRVEGGKKRDVPELNNSWKRKDRRKKSIGSRIRSSIRNWAWAKKPSRGGADEKHVCLLHDPEDTSYDRTHVLGGQTGPNFGV